MGRTRTGLTMLAHAHDRPRRQSGHQVVELQLGLREEQVAEAVEHRASRAPASTGQRCPWRRRVVLTMIGQTSEQDFTCRAQHGVGRHVDVRLSSPDSETCENNRRTTVDVVGRGDGGHRHQPKSRAPGVAGEFAAAAVVAGLPGMVDPEAVDRAASLVGRQLGELAELPGNELGGRGVL